MVFVLNNAARSTASPEFIHYHFYCFPTFMKPTTAAYCSQIEYESEYFRPDSRAGAQWEILALFGSLQNPDFMQILGWPKKLIFQFFADFIMSQKSGPFCPLCVGSPWPVMNGLVKAKQGCYVLASGASLISNIHSMYF